MGDGTITTLLQSGLDSFSNLYDIRFTFPSKAGITVGSAGFYSVRANSVTIPEFSLGEYKVDYKGMSITRPNAQITGERKLTITFRLDADYYLMDHLTNWKNIWVNPNGEGNIGYGALSGGSNSGKDVLGDNNTYYGTIQVVGYKSTTTLMGIADPGTTDNIGEDWYFYDVICTKVGVPTYTRTGADPSTISSEFIFGRMVGPGLGAKEGTSPVNQ